MLDLHPTAVIHPDAKLHDHVCVGPLCVVGPNVIIGPHTHLISQISIQGPTELGARNVVHPFAAIGGEPQHRDHHGEETQLLIGDDNVIREHVTIHRGTVIGGGTTRIGDGCLLMAGVHVAHDVSLGNHVTLTNGTLLGGHVQVGDWAVAAGHVAVAPFARIGESAFLAGNAMVERDVPPFLIAAGDRATLRAVNRVGLQRRALPTPSIDRIKRAFRELFAPSVRMDPTALEAEGIGNDPFVARLLAFLQSPSRLGIAPRHRRGSNRGSIGPLGIRDR